MIDFPTHRATARPQVELRSRAAGLVCVLLFLAVPAGAAAQATGFVQGVVQDPSASGGITGAMLQVLDPDSTVIGSAFSGANGTFLLEVVEGGPYVIRVQSMGFRITNSQPFEIVPGDTLQLPRISLLPDPVRRTPKESARGEAPAADYGSSAIEPPRYALRPGPGSK